VVTAAHGETVTRLRATADTNVYSGQADDLDWSDPDELDIVTQGVEPVGVFEPLEVGRAPVEVDFRIFLPYGADIEPLDRVVVRGDTCTVEGARLDWRNPFTGDEPGSVITVKKVAG
jgi:hypothetical protein